MISIRNELDLIEGTSHQAPVADLLFCLPSLALFPPSASKAGIMCNSSLFSPFLTLLILPYPEGSIQGTVLIVPQLNL